MGANVFISWSGDLSKKLAEVFYDWIPKVLQSVKPYFSPGDIDKGARWSRDLSDELESSQLGIICLTRDNQHNPWVLFEAGALSKNLKESKVCPLLFNLDATEVTGPLATFQAAIFCKDDVKKLIESINDSCSDTKLNQHCLDDTFEMWWPQLEKSISAIISENNSSEKIEKRTEKDMIAEILELTRLMNARTLQSGQKSVSRFIVEDLVSLFKRFRNKMIHGIILDPMDFAEVERVLFFLCKEANCEDLLISERTGPAFRSFPLAPVHEEKNAIDAGECIKRDSELQEKDK